MATFYKLLADSVVAVHLAYVAFVVVAQVLIIIGLVCRWQWVRNLRFRVIHLVMVEVVALEGWFGIICPMTDWDKQLRVWQGEVITVAVQPAEPKSAPINSEAPAPSAPQTAPMPERPTPPTPMPQTPMPETPMPMAPMPEPPAPMPVAPQPEPAPAPPVAADEPAEEATFVGKLLSSILYLEVQQRVLDTWYVRFGLVTLALFVLFPPRTGRWTVSGLAGVVLVWTGVLFSCAAHYERITRPEPLPGVPPPESLHRIAPLEFGIWMMALGVACCGVHCLCRLRCSQAGEQPPVSPS